MYRIAALVFFTVGLFGVSPSAMAAAPCSPFTSFPLVLNFGTGANTGSGEDLNCALRKVQAAVNTALPAIQVSADAVAELARTRIPTIGKREINAVDTKYAGGVVSDCVVDTNGVGTGTDNGPALRSARDAWVAAGNGAVLRVPAGQYCIATPVEMNMYGQVGMVFDASQAIFVMKNAPMVGFDFHNGQQIQIKARFIDGGVFNYGATSPYVVDYGAVPEAVTAGGQEAIKVSGVVGYTVDLIAQNYAGRLLRIARARTGEPTTGGLKGTIKTTRGSSLSKPRTAQSLYTDNGNNPPTGFWGHLDSLHNDFDAWGPSIFDVNDVAISYLDGAYAFTGLTLGGVQVFKGGIIYVGDIDSNVSNVHVGFGPSPATGRLSSFMSIDHLAMLNTGKGLVATNTDPSGRGVDIRQVLMGGNGCDTAVTLSNVRGAEIGISAQAPCQTAAVVNGSSTADISLDVRATSLGNTFVYVAPEVPGNVRISGQLVGPAPGFSAVSVVGTTPVRLQDLDVYSDTGAALLNLAAAGNKVRWVSGSKAGTSPAYAGNAPSYVSPSVLVQ
jgi:hypothetical protein